MAGVNVGRHARLKRAIVEKGVRVPEGAVVGYNLRQDAKRFRVTESGVVVVEEFVPEEFGAEELGSGTLGPNEPEPKAPAF